MLLNSHISAYTGCLAEKVCGLVRSTWGTSQGEDKLGARDKILNTKVVRRACAGRAPGKHSPYSLSVVPGYKALVQTRVCGELKAAFGAIHFSQSHGTV